MDFGSEDDEILRLLAEFPVAIIDKNFKTVSFV